MSENLANNAVTQLQAPVITSDSTITVLSSTDFPSPSFRIKIDSELMLVTSITGEVWSVDRGAESTTVSAHSTNASVVSVLTVEGLTSFVADAIGDSSAPVIGSTSITTLGTVTTGVWNATDLAESQVTNLVSDLASKADSSSLATVATSGSYTDLDDLPTLGTSAALDAGVASGVATLDPTGHLTAEQCPSAVIGACVYQGTWNATTNSPSITGGVGTQGHYYVVATAGTTSINGTAVWSIGDWIIFNGSAWDKIDGAVDVVQTFNGRYGVVTPATNDYSFSQLSGSLAVGQLPTPIWSDGTNATVGGTSAITWGLTSEAIHTGKLSVDGSLACNSTTGEHLFTNSTSTPGADVCTVNVGLVWHQNSGGCSALRFARYDYSATNNTEMGAIGYGNNGTWSSSSSNYDGAMYFASSDLSGVAPWSSSTLIPVVIGQYGTISTQSSTPNTFFNQIILDNVGAINFQGGPYNAAVNLMQIPQSGLCTIGPVTSSSTNLLNVVDAQTIASSGYQAKTYYNSGNGYGGIRYTRVNVGAAWIGVAKYGSVTGGVVGTDQSTFLIATGIQSTGDTSSGTQVASFTSSTASIAGALTVPTIALSSSGGTNQFLAQTSSGGTVTAVQPAFSNLSGTATVSQLPGSILAQTSLYFPDLPFTSPSSKDVDWTAISSTPSGYTVVTNGGTITYLGGGGVRLAKASSGGYITAEMASLTSSTDFTAWCKVTLDCNMSVTIGGLVLADGVTTGSGNQILFGMQNYSAFTATGTPNYSGPVGYISTNYQSQNSAFTLLGTCAQTNYIRVRRNTVSSSTTWYAATSIDGIHWAETTFSPSFTPVYLGIGVSSGETASQLSSAVFQFNRLQIGSGKGNQPLGQQASILQLTQN